MYGMVNRAIEEMVTSAHGEEAWENIKTRAAVDIDVFVSNQGYPDELTYRLVGAASEELRTPADEILQSFGVHWILNTAQRYYGDLMSSGGASLKQFLINLPNFHARLSMMFPDLAPPEFSVSDADDRSLRLHYRSHRAGLAPFVRGLILGLGELFATKVEVEQAAHKAAGADHDEFVVRW